MYNIMSYHIVALIICFLYSEHHTKVNMTWNPNDTVTFQQIRRWHFVPERSNGTLRDAVTNINTIAVVNHF
jgi:glycopeptide antibiotics resistance protein